MTAKVTSIYQGIATYDNGQSVVIADLTDAEKAEVFADFYGTTNPTIAQIRERQQAAQPPPLHLNGAAFPPLSIVDKTGENTPKSISAYELLMRPHMEIETLWKPFLPFGSLTLLYGASDTGKSMFLRNLCLAVVGGSSTFCGFELHPKHRAALYLATEDDDGLTASALRAAQSELGTLEDAKRLHFVFDTEADIAALLTKTPVDLVVIDCFTDTMPSGKKLNDAQDVREIAGHYAETARQFGCAVVLLHHSGKRAEDGAPSKHSAVGSQSLQAKCRAAYEFRADNDDVALRHFCVTKSNFLPSEYKRQSYILRFHEDTLTFSDTRNLDGTHARKDFAELAKPLPETPGRPSKITGIEAAEIFGADGELTTAAIIARSATIYGAPKRTAERWITEALTKQEITQLGRGLYSFRQNPSAKTIPLVNNFGGNILAEDESEGELW
ncbi:hypothetical protein MASR2M18_21780 [Ignavibacteria bacterium]